MCVGQSYTPGNNQTSYELHGFRRCGIYAIFQLIFTLFGIIIMIVGQQMFGINWIIGIIIGAVIIVIFNILPNAKPFFLNLWRMGRVYIVFDGNNREILLISTHFGGLQTKQNIICSYSQFRGIAVHHKTHKMLLLCKREESLLLKQIGEVLPEGKPNIESILEEISLFWFQGGMDGFFGITFIDFKDGIVAEGNVHVNVDYDYYLKRSETWKPKNNMMDVNGVNGAHGYNNNHRNKVNDNDDFDDDQYLDPKKNKKNVRLDSVDGAAIDVGSDDDIVVDYV